jgi:hypothetical protein
MWRDDAYLLDMLLAARKALEFTHGNPVAQSLPVVGKGWSGPMPVRVAGAPAFPAVSYHCADP